MIFVLLLIGAIVAVVIKANKKSTNISQAPSVTSTASRPILPTKKTFVTPGGKTWDLFTDMLEQPHLLIAGATGSGKSVIINGLIDTIMHRLPFDQERTDGHDGAQLILIDPKRVELISYKSLPHTILYASEPKDMLSALQYALDITEKRYTQMQQRRQKKYSGGDVYVVIDEWADLMTTQGKLVVPVVQRLAQIGRAARVHIIMATQTPISEVLPTKIKCNFDARVGLRARSAQDSRNIIGKPGLENLPRYGEGYYMKPGDESFWDIPYVRDEEIDRDIAWWDSQTCRRSLAVA